MLRFLVIALLLTPQLSAQTWNQWGGGPRHTGSIPVYGQSLREQMADIIYDPFVPLERAEAGGATRALPDAALRRRRRVHGGEGRHVHRASARWETQTWSMRKFQWVDGQLVDALDGGERLESGAGRRRAAVRAGVPRGAGERIRLHAGAGRHGARGRPHHRRDRAAPGAIRATSRSARSTSPARSPSSDDGISTTTRSSCRRGCRGRAIIRARGW